VPLGRYFFFVGSLLVAMLFVAEWYLPDSPQSFVREAYVDKSIIRIKSAHKWPERVAIDTSLPTIVPPFFSGPGEHSIDHPASRGVCPGGCAFATGLKNSSAPELEA
jgi:hypothetical protein